jgi:hypothetical protein
MAGPTDNLPTLFVPRGPTPYGNPGAPVVAAAPTVTNFVPRGPTPYGTPAAVRVVPAAASPTPSAPVATPASPAPAPTTPVAPPAATSPTTSAAGVPNNGAVSPTPGAGNPLPPSMQGTDTPLPAGTPNAAANAGAASALAGLPPPANSGAAAASPALADNGPEIIRGGVVSNPQGSVVPASGIRDPQAAINAGFDTQTARAQSFISQAMNYVNAGGDIFERATRGRFVNGLLNATVGPNNVGAVQGQGQDSLNSALAGIQAAGIGAGASEYGAQLGYQASAERNQAAENLEAQQRTNTPVVVGQRTVMRNGIAVPEPVYGLPVLGAGNNASGFRTILPNGMLTSPVSPTAPANPAVGTTRTRASGAVERWNGQAWTNEAR